MRLHILELDDLGPDAEARGVRFRDLFINWLAPALPEAQFSSTLVPAGEPLPAPGDYDAFILTGSRAGVYDDLPWMQPLKDFLLAAAAANVPVGGVCFGHQIMAATHGGMVDKYHGGWNIGRQEHDVTPNAQALFEGCETLPALSLHQDQVIVPPDSARIIVSSEASPHGALLYDGFPALSVQFHPEFQPQTVSSMLDAAPEGRMPEHVTTAARASLGGALDNALLGRAFARFYRQALADDANKPH